MTERLFIGGVPVLVSASAGALIHYKKQFGVEYTDDHRELCGLPAEQKYLKLAEVGMRLLWAMAKAADRALPPYSEWIPAFGSKDLALAIQEAETLFLSSLRDDGRRDSGREFTSENLIASALACGLGIGELDDMPLPMVIDTIEEWCRLKGYAEEDARPATQEDFDAL